jgi:hypothetical protein
VFGTAIAPTPPALADVLTVVLVPRTPPAGVGPGVLIVVLLDVVVVVVVVVVLDVVLDVVVEVVVDEELELELLGVLVGGAVGVGVDTGIDGGLTDAEATWPSSVRPFITQRSLRELSIFTSIGCEPTVSEYAASALPDASVVIVASTPVGVAGTVG